jgi:hypothetical protein
MDFQKSVVIISAITASSWWYFAFKKYKPRKSKSKYIECPAILPKTQQGSLFLGGGISGCPQWQKEIQAILENSCDVILVNPRRYQLNLHFIILIGVY